MMRSIVLLLVIATGVLAKLKTTVTIRYNGTMGISFDQSDIMGWRITFIHPVEPRQPNLYVGDIITGIAGNSFLGKTQDEQNAIYDAHIADGVEVNIERMEGFPYFEKNNPHVKYHYHCGFPGCLKDGWQEKIHGNSRWWEHDNGDRSNYKPSRPKSWHKSWYERGISTWFQDGFHAYKHVQELKRGAKKRRRPPTLPWYRRAWVFITGETAS